MKSALFFLWFLGTGCLLSAQDEKQSPTNIVSEAEVALSSNSTLTSAQGEAILKPVLDAVLAGYKTEDAEINWGRGGGEHVFAAHGLLVVKETDIETIAAKLSTELDKLPAVRGWK